jgi:hypothetical protein
MTKTIPAVGSTVRPAASDKILYRVVSATEHGCYVEAIGTEVVDVAGRKARPLHYSEKRFSLAVSRDNGVLFDGSWRAWQVVS